MKLDSEARYTDSHEWARKEGNDIVVGITDYAQESLSDIVYVELPEVGDVLERADNFGVVESVKAVSDVYMPVSGEIIAVNEELEDSPELVNQEPFGEGWLIRVAPDDMDEFEEMMDADAYEALVAEEEG